MRFEPDPQGRTALHKEPAAELPCTVYRRRIQNDFGFEYLSYGGTLSEFLPENASKINEIVDETHLGYINTRLKAAAEAKHGYKLEYVLNTPEGEKWVCEWGSCILDENGSPIYFDGIILECTEMVQSKEVAMTNDRPYQKAVSRLEAIEEIKACSGTQFDSYVVEKFIKIFY